VGVLLPSTPFNDDLVCARVHASRWYDHSCKLKRKLGFKDYYLI
jgi:hypothetical protein